MQNIPARNKEIRSIFCAGSEHEETKEFNDFLHLYDYDEIETTRGWLNAKDLKENDVLICEDNNLTISHINNLGGILELYFK